jgi:hypothetical protein
MPGSPGSATQSTELHLRLYLVHGIRCIAPQLTLPRTMADEGRGTVIRRRGVRHGRLPDSGRIMAKHLGPPEFDRPGGLAQRRTSGCPPNAAWQRPHRVLQGNADDRRG